ncbi:MAG: phosphatase PAP2 family protein [candidate division NC10 bacterium]|nr:phosphatase PAP2 family protein [candidate division NC10 bacterium]
MEQAIDLISLGCSLVRSYPFEKAMDQFDHLGDGLFAVGVTSVTIAYGFVARDRRMKQAGFVALLAALVAGLLANLFKIIFQMPRPIPRRGSYGFPSGHTSIAFALAGVLGQAFPTAAPFLYLLALLAGVARLYYRSHFVIDVIGGGLLGTGSGLLIARRLLVTSGIERKRPRTRWGWVLPIAIGVQAFVFFTAYERTLEIHRRPIALPVGDPSTRTVIAFGTPEARTLLLEGWSRDETWEGTFPMVWAEGLESKLRIPSLPPSDHRVRLRVQPFVGHGGPACQVMEVALNGIPAARLLVEKGWQEYEMEISKHLIRPGSNEIRFRFAYAESPGTYGPSKDGRVLSVAFASLEAIVDERKGPVKPGGFAAR